MQDFIFSLPTRVVFGAGTVDSLGREVSAHGGHAFVVTGTAFARRSGLIERVRTSLDSVGIRATIYDQVGPNTDVGALDDGGKIARETGADVIVGLGGGSTLDAAKGIAVAALSDRPIWEYTRHEPGVHPAPIEGALPIVQVPIIASTGSETNDSAVMFHRELHLKASIRHPSLYAKVAVVDPTLTFSVPPHYTAVGGMNLVSQMLERYLTSEEFPVTDRIAEGLVRVVMDSLPRAMRDGEDLDARNNLSWVAILASTVAVAGRSEASPLRAMAHPLTAHFDVEHGCAVTALWPSFIRYALANRFRLPQIGRFKRYALLGRQVFGVHETDDEVAAETASYRLVSWLRSMNMPTDLPAIGIQTFEPVSVSQLADEAMAADGAIRRVPGGLTTGDVEHVYEGALRSA